ncbi:MAG TPA: (deoxy)nucleoside triphosphate pyrophosphohydrolase [Polyangiaceae bacterium]|nr:(deoxy)nucleoside triphosphate pyrophosphohydrolase [Polyangiaceae bacterium]HMR81325.1 (deoxy)nucleoside triphosphate pyrophosphohydrolase [Polyangiaceae bacterium]
MSPNAEAIAVVGAVALRAGKCLVAKRGPGGSAAHRWEFPGGKVKAGESQAEALVREIREELELHIRVGALIGSVRAQASTALIELSLWQVEIVAGTPVLREHEEVRWVGPEELSALDFAAADRPLLGRIQGLLAV